MMTNIFLSHSTHDKELVIKFDLVLNQMGIETFRDDKSIGYGENIPSHIYKKIKKSSHFFYFISKSSLQSRWVNSEVTTASMLEKDKDYEFIVPILIDNIDIPVSVINKKTADFRDHILDELKIFNIIKSLNNTESIQNESKLKLNSYYEKGLIALKKHDYKTARTYFEKHSIVSSDYYNSKLLSYICSISNIPIHQIRREYIDEIASYINTELERSDYLSLCFLGILHIDYYKIKYTTPIGITLEKLQNLLDKHPQRNIKHTELEGIKYSSTASVLLRLRNF